MEIQYDKNMQNIQNIDYFVKIFNKMFFFRYSIKLTHILYQQFKFVIFFIKSFRKTFKTLENVELRTFPYRGRIFRALCGFRTFRTSNNAISIFFWPSEKNSGLKVSKNAKCIKVAVKVLNWNQRTKNWKQKSVSYLGKGDELEVKQLFFTQFSAF